MRNVKLVTDSTNAETSQPFYDKSWALLIGINEYGGRHAELKNARNDAAAMADLLQNDYGFDHIITLHDGEATYSAIIQWLRDRLPTSIGPNDRLIIFFAGHGTTRISTNGRTRGYLIPHDARTAQYSTYIDMIEVSDACGFIRAKHIFLILDCCFSGVAAVARAVAPPASQEKITDTYLQAITQRSAWQVLTAGAEDQLAADSGRRPGHSAFTGALLTGLEGGADSNSDGIITASDLASYVKPEVIHETTAVGGQGQTPFFNYLQGSGQGDFVFVRSVESPPMVSRREPLPVRKPLLAPYPWKIIIAAIVALLVIGGVAYFLWPRSVQIPILQGLAVNDARATIVALNLAEGDLIGGDGGGTVEPGRIVATTPEAGLKVDRNSPVHLVVAMAPTDTPTPEPIHTPTLDLAATATVRAQVAESVRAQGTATTIAQAIDKYTGSWEVTEQGSPYITKLTVSRTAQTMNLTVSGLVYPISINGNVGSAMCPIATSNECAWGSASGRYRGDPVRFAINPNEELVQRITLTSVNDSTLLAVYQIETGGTALPSESFLFKRGNVIAPVLDNIDRE